MNNGQWAVACPGLGTVNHMQCDKRKRAAKDHLFVHAQARARFIAPQIFNPLGGLKLSTLSLACVCLANNLFVIDIINNYRRALELCKISFNRLRQLERIFP